jgi:[ribosomal protein S5]-alanine N-acetyltransferase
MIMSGRDFNSVTIKTERLTLREFEDSDLAAVHDYAQDSETVKYLEWGPNTLKETSVFLNESLAFQKEKPRITFDMAIISDSEHRLVGACSVTILDKKKKTAALGYVLNSKFWGRGYATEAAQALARFAFEELGVDKLMATCDALNTSSESVMKKLSMEPEQRLYRDKFIKGMYRDTLVYSVNRATWTKNHSKEGA